ncbi:uncharacterized protein LOC136074235 [Hydra vulgaris]|uniref:Uncharacterized protein LOC136074235 n=1 Tax=Hydra vulgaris TaxID=6087 RepID=A0ABM4B1E3_HYDVU
MDEAVAAVKEKRMTQRTASKTYKVPRCTLQNRLNGKTEMGEMCPGCSTKLGSEDELKLVEYASKRASMGICFGRRQFMKYTGDIASKRGIPFKNGLPSKKWWSLLKKRHSTLRLRVPEGTAAIRHQCMDKEKVSIYFKALKQVMDEMGLYCKPHCVCNMDETSLQLQHTPDKVVTKSCSRYIQSRTSGNCETITIIATISASGTHIPPHIIVKCKTRRALNGFEVLSAPERSAWSVSDSGWTKQGIALLWFSESFLTNIRPERPQILILDRHSSHNFIELIESAIKNNIIIAELPAHTSHWLQPCDRSVFGPLKQHYNVACQNMMNMYPGVLVSHRNFCALFRIAWVKALSEKNIKSGFNACGIFPFNPNKIPPEAYLPNNLYEPSQLTEAKYEKSIRFDEDKKHIINPFLEKSDKTSEIILQPHQTNFAVSNVQIDFAIESNCVEKKVNSSSLVLPTYSIDDLESVLTEKQRQCFAFCFDKGFDTKSDETFMSWKSLKMLSPDVLTALPKNTIALDHVSTPLVNNKSNDTTYTLLTNASASYGLNNLLNIEDDDNDILPYPKKILPTTKKFLKNGLQPTSFILTSKEACDAKILEIETKREKNKEKENRSRKRFEALQQKLKEKEECKLLKSQIAEKKLIAKTKVPLSDKANNMNNKTKPN